MIAEIHKKKTIGEDQLTGNVFGSLRYLPFSCGIQPILQKTVFPTHLLDCISDMKLQEWDRNIHFWNDCRYKDTEPDVVIELADTVILIEVKLNSGLGERQLEREANLLLEKYPHCDNKILIILALESAAADIYEEYRKDLPKQITFGYITWQKILTVLNDIHPPDPFQRLIIKDIVNLLIRKGFESFRGFNDYAFSIDPHNYWEFNTDFCFKNYNTIREDLYYEFR